jgi:thrombospondin type-1 domain-containing protein 4
MPRLRNFSLSISVLKTADQRFLLNGDYTVSLSGFYDAAGSMFDYRRIDGLTNGSSASFNRKIESVTEWITCLGPTTESVHLMVSLAFEPRFCWFLHAFVQMFLRRKYFQVLAKVHNPGVKYEYLLPVSPNSISTSEEENSSDSEMELQPFE